MTGSNAIDTSPEAVARYVANLRRDDAEDWESHAKSAALLSALSAALEEARGALEPFVAKMQKVEDQYRKRGGNPDSFPDTHPSFDISADSRELPLGSWRRARTALATINAALGRVEG